MGAAVALALALACGRAEPPAQRLAAGTPIVLVSIDTLRSDRLPVYGYGAIETPAIDRLAADSLVFEHAYSPVPLTLPAHASMLTGLLPPEHGVRDNVGYRFDAAASPTYLPAVLDGLGYATAAFVSSFVLRGASGLDDGFDLYDDLIASAGATSDIGGAQRSGAETLRAATDWLRRESTGPFFLFFHLYEPHTPYDPPEPYRSRYASAYDGEVAAADAYVGALLDVLTELGVYDRALIVLTSDHGESLGEHGYLEHGPFLYREAIQVPLLLKLPGGERGGERVAAAAQLTDIPPTVLSLLGQPVPPTLGGRSLLELGGEERRIFSETVYPRLHFGWSDLASIVEFPFHYIHGPDPELFDLASDPGETVNLLRRERARATALKAEIDRYDRSLEPPGAEDPETREKLAALGYLTSTVIDDGSELADPKARIHVLGQMSDALHLFREGRHDEAGDAFRRVLAEEPRMIEAWQGLGAALIAAGRAEEATEAYLEAVELSGGASHLALAAASALIAAGRLDEAEKHAELASSIHPSAYDLLAQIAMRRGDLDEADGLLERVLAAGGRRVGPLITQAELRLRQERFREAVELTETAEANLGDGPRRLLRGAFLIRGDALTQLEDLPRAKQAYRAEIENEPDQLLAYARLAFLLALEGDAAAAGATLRRLVEANPRPAAYATAVEALRRMGDDRSAAAVLAQALRRWPEDAALRSLASGP